MILIKREAEHYIDHIHNAGGLSPYGCRANSQG